MPRDVHYPHPEPVKFADNKMLATEARDLMGPPPEPWVILPPPLSWKLEVWPIQRTYTEFTRLFHIYKP